MPAKKPSQASSSSSSAKPRRRLGQTNKATPEQAKKLAQSIKPSLPPLAKRLVARAIAARNTATRPYIRVAAIALAALVAIYALIFTASSQVLSQKLQPQEEITLEVEKGQGLIATLNSLQQKGLLNSPRLARLAYYFQGLPGQLQFGLYVIRPNMTLKDLINDIATGQQRNFRIVVDIGSTFAVFHRKLMDNPNIKKTTENMTIPEIAELLGITHQNPEGLFYADTYFFHKGEEDLDILRRSHERLIQTLNREWQTRSADVPHDTPYEALILASIVEKETNLANERSLIAGVFHNRLRRGMRLQTDPTVIYGLGDKFDGNIRKKDLRTRTPYNTYVIRGLPPTPISLVDERSIRATMHPEASEFIYFVAKADGTGSHHFSVDYEAHKAAIRRYLLK